jgi:hypothetical protein
MKSSHWTLAAGFGLILPAYLGLFISGGRLICPFPLVTIIPFSRLSSAQLSWLAVLVPTFLFFAWSPRLFRGQDKIPKRSIVLLGVLTVLSGVYFVDSWTYGMHYQGAHFTYGLCLANVGWLLLLWVAFVRGLRKSSFVNNLLAHWLLFAWLGWYAFPYLGELP